MEEKKSCPCKREKCKRHGNCSACQEHHHGAGKQSLTSCERLRAKEEKRNGRKTEKNSDESLNGNMTKGGDTK